MLRPRILLLASTRHRRSALGLSLVEILVVISVIGVLVGLLVPALAGVRRSTRATMSQSNLRQWGVGTASFTAMHNDTLPWEGLRSADEMSLNFAERLWWANVIPPFVGQKSYRQLSDDATAAGVSVPMPGDDGNIFVDPGAQAPPEGPHMGGPVDNAKQFFFCYVPNLQLNAKRQDDGDLDPMARVRLSEIDSADRTIIMLEMRSVKWELPASDPFYGFGLARQRSDWKRLAARHFDGGHVLMADGHVQHVLFRYATTNDRGTRNPDEPDADWNKPDIIWNPRARALEGPGS